jgi:hypothetical protein
MTQDAPPADATAFHLSQDKPMAGLVGGVVALFVVGLWIWIERGGDGLFIVGAGLLVFAYWHWRTTRDQQRAEVDREARLILDAEGVTIPDLFSERVPWWAIDAIDLYSMENRDYLSLRLERPQDYGFEPHAGQRFARMLGDRAIGFDYESLDCDRTRLVAALKRHAPERLTEKL